MRPASETVEFRRGLRKLSLVVAITLLAAIAWHSRTSLLTTLRSVEPLEFLVAVGLGVIFMMAQGILFATLLRKHGATASNAAVLFAFLISQPGKYVPGRVGSLFLQALHLTGKTSVGAVAFANLELMALGLLQMVTLGLAFLWSAFPAVVVFVLAAGIGVSSWMLRANPVGRLLRRCPLIARKAGITSVETRSPVEWKYAVGLNLASFAGNAVASACVLLAIGTSLPAGIFTPLLATLYLSFALSQLVLVVPAGLGVRESLAVTIGMWIDLGLIPEQLLSLALLARAWQLAVDAACFAISTFWGRRFH